jgi:hypothetical protein
VQKLLGVSAAGVAAGGRAAATDPAAAPSLFPLDPGPDPAARSDRPPSPEKPPRRLRQRPTNPGTRAALEQIRRELIEIRGLLDQLMRRPKPR